MHKNYFPCDAMHNTKLKTVVYVNQLSMYSGAMNDGLYEV